MPSPQDISAIGMRRRACESCTKGKSKCLPISADECERCNRLGKECVYLNVLGKRKSPACTSRARLLEKKLDGILSIISKHSGAPNLGGILSQIQIGSLPDLLGNPSGSPPFTVQKSDMFSDAIDRGLITLKNAESLLSDYRIKAAQHFPFVIIPPEADVASIRLKKPLLFLCIMASMMVENCPVQRQLGEEVRIQLNKRLLLDSEISLELLQGLLVYLAWYQYHFQPKTQQILQLAQLCVAQVHGLGLDQNPTNSRRKVDLGPPETGDFRGSPRSSDEIRAFLGAYCTTSWIATKFRTRCAIPYTKYIRQAHNSLQENNEYPTDQLLSLFVRTNELACRICNTLAYDDLDNRDDGSDQVGNLTMQAFVQELATLQNSTPPQLKHSIALDLEFHLVGTLISEAALHKEFWSDPTLVSHTSMGLSLPSTLRQSMLWNLTQNCKAILDKVIECPEQETWRLTFYSYAKICRVLSCLTSLVHVQLDVHSEGSHHKGTSAQHAYPWDATTIEMGTELRACAQQLQHKFRHMSALISNEPVELDAPDMMEMFSQMIEAEVSTYERKTGDRDAFGPDHTVVWDKASNPQTIPSPVSTLTTGPNFFGPFVGGPFNPTSGS